MEVPDKMSLGLAMCPRGRRGHKHLGSEVVLHHALQHTAPVGQWAGSDGWSSVRAIN